MRLWHRRLFPYLPDSQLLAQKRECDLMFKDYLEGKETKHILIYYVWNYDIENLIFYYLQLKKEFGKRNFKFNEKWLKQVTFDVECKKGKLELYPYGFHRHHDSDYLLTCFMNLREKYYAGQKDFSHEKYERLYKYVNDRLDGILDIMRKIGVIDECRIPKKQ